MNNAPGSTQSTSASTSILVTPTSKGMRPTSLLQLGVTQAAWPIAGLPSMICGLPRTRASGWTPSQPPCEKADLGLSHFSSRGREERSEKARKGFVDQEKSASGGFFNSFDASSLAAP